MDCMRTKRFISLNLIYVCDRNFVETDVPSSFFIGSRTSGYGNATLFSQRFLRWYKTRVIQLFYMLYYLFFFWNHTIIITVVQKLFFIWDILNSVLNYSKYWIMILYALVDVRFTFIMYAACVGSGLIGFLIFNYYQLRKEERLPLYMIIINPIYNLYDTLVFFVAIMWSVLILPFIIVNKKPKYQDNIELQNIVNQLHNICK